MSSAASTSSGTTSLICLVFGLAVAREAIGAERESERGEPRVVRRIGETIGAGRQQTRQAAGQERIARAVRRLRARTARRRARRPRRQHRCRPGLGSKPALGEGARGGVEPVAIAGPGRGGDEPDRNGRMAGVPAGRRSDAWGIRSWFANTGSATSRRRGREPVNHSLGLTLYCSTTSWAGSDGHPSEQAACARITTAIRLSRLGGARGACRLPARRCKTTGLTETTGSIASRSRAPTATGGSEAEVWGERYRKNPNDAEAAIAMRRPCAPPASAPQAAAVLEQATIHNPKNTAVLGAYGRALADTGSLQPGARSAEPRAYARPAGLAHPVGAGRGARPDGPARGSAALLCERAENHAGRAFRAVQSRPVLCAVEESAQGRGDPAARQRAQRASRACGRISRWWSACRAVSPRPRKSRAAICSPEEARGQRRLSAADARAERSSSAARRKRQAADAPLNAGRCTALEPRLRTSALARSRRLICCMTPSRGWRPVRESRRTAPAGRTGSSARSAWAAAPAAFFSASDMRMSRFSCASTRRVCASGVP